MTTTVTAMAHVDRGPDDDRVSYQTSLRAIGKYLDERGESRVRVLEVPGGFEVSSQHSDDAVQVECTFFPHTQLQAQARGPYHRKMHVFRKGAPSHAAYQDLFRALGWELEAWNAYLIVLEDLEDGCRLTYQYYGVDAGCMFQKRHLVLGVEETARLLKRAMARRTHA